MADEQQESWWRRLSPIRTILAALGVVLLLAGLVWLWWQGIPALYPTDDLSGSTAIGGPNPDTARLSAIATSRAARLNAIATTRAALLAGLVGIAALGTLYVNARTTAESLRISRATVRVSEENLQEAKRSQERTFELAERGHVTDRFSTAIEHLGHEALDVRLGGIYALEQLATDSENARDQASIVEVLCAFVRAHCDPLFQYKVSLPA